nr:MAG TPA: hypothetical protein [Caudoviricetes sp.]
MSLALTQTMLITHAWLFSQVLIQSANFLVYLILSF